MLLARIEDEAHLRHLGVAEMDPGKRIKRIVEKPVTPLDQEGEVAVVDAGDGLAKADGRLVCEAGSHRWWSR